MLTKPLSIVLHTSRVRQQFNLHTYSFLVSVESDKMKKEYRKYLPTFKDSPLYKRYVDSQTFNSRMKLMQSIHHIGIVLFLPNRISPS